MKIFEKVVSLQSAILLSIYDICLELDSEISFYSTNSSSSFKSDAILRLTRLNVRQEEEHIFSVL